MFTSKANKPKNIVVPYCQNYDCLLKIQMFHLKISLQKEPLTVTKLDFMFPRGT